MRTPADRIKDADVRRCSRPYAHVHPDATQIIQRPGRQVEACQEPAVEKTQQADTKTLQSRRRSDAPSAALAIPCGPLNLASSPPPLWLAQRSSQCMPFAQHGKRLHNHYMPVWRFSDNSGAIRRLNRSCFLTQVAICPRSREAGRATEADSDAFRLPWSSGLPPVPHSACLRNIMVAKATATTARAPNTTRERQRSDHT